MSRTTNKPPLEPETQAFIDSLADAPVLHTLPYEEARDLLTQLQSEPEKLLDVEIEDLEWPVGPTGTTRIRVVRPPNTQAQKLPVILYLHGGGWILGNPTTHDRLVRELAVGVHAAVVFVDYINAPEAQHPTQIEQSYASLQYLVEHAEQLSLDADRVAVVGDSAGGAMAAAVTLLAKERGGPKLVYQVLFYPVTDFATDNSSYRQFADGPWLIEKNMRWMFETQGLDGSEDHIAFPNRATAEQLENLPDALVITVDDILRDEGESYAQKLSAAGVKVTSLRYLGTIHDFVMINSLRPTPAATSAIELTIGHLKAAFGNKK